MVDRIRLDVNQAEWHRLFESSDGEVAEDIRARTAQAARSARRRARRRTGELKSKVYETFGSDVEGFYGEYGDTAPYSVFVEKGHKAPDGSYVSPRRFLRPALRSAKRVRRKKG